LSQLLAIDWGTSSLRGALLDNDGAVLEERAFERGILTVAPGKFATVFASCFGDWMQSSYLCLMSGMVGSQQGWQEAAYCPCPAGFNDLATHLQWLTPGRIAIVPGLCIDSGGVPDVMRGEETQIFGALQLLGVTSATLVLPGTHSKWVSVNQHRVTNFSTWMTGEFYALLTQHSILARTLPADSPKIGLDSSAFEQGVAYALSGKGLLHTAFSARTLGLFNRLAKDAVPSYLSGLVVGEELKAQTLAPGDVVVAMGAEALTVRYELALKQLGVSVKRVGAGATWCGLHKIASTLSEK
jgi:2-dehydro-3-deoxygalactonokinase